MVFSWSNPYLSSPQDVRLALISDNAYRNIYAALFERTYLEPGRLLNVVLVVIAGYALLSAYWKPIDAAMGWFFIPLGQATLYVFIMHIFFALIISNVPVLREGTVWLNSLAYVLVLLLMWAMVKTKFLFRIVPR
jgi:fucose 4-O-acetylase-like acetyltransferase